MSLPADNGGNLGIGRSAMRIFATAMIFIVCATPAFAQFGFPTNSDGRRFLKTDEDVRQELLLP